jgi:hypothetical protein
MKYVGLGKNKEDMSVYSKEQKMKLCVWTPGRLRDDIGWKKNLLGRALIAGKV